MTSVKKSLIGMGTLGVLLLVLLVIFAITLLVGDNFKEQICENDGGTYASGACSTDSTTYNATVTILSEIVTAVGFIGLIVITFIGALLIGMGKGMLSEKDM